MAAAKKGRPSHPLDIKMAATLRNHPGEWFPYPYTERWPDENAEDPAVIRKLAARLNVRCYGHYGTYQPDDQGRYQVRFDSHDRTLEMRYKTNDMRYIA